MFTLADVQRVLKIQPESAKVIVSRLKSAGRILPLERGRYRLIRQENLAKLQELGARNQKLYQLALELYRRYPDLKALVLYGSQITNSADVFSDYDAMVITEVPRDRNEDRRIEQELGEELGIRVHLTIYSEQGFRVFAMTEPHLKFWLNDAVILTEDRGLRPLPPTAKWGYKEALYVAEGYIDVGDEGRGPRRAIYYLTALKIILMVEHALNLDYGYENVRREMERSVGRDLVMAVRRNHLSPKGIGKEQIDKLRRIARKKLRKVRTELESIGENESDLRWKELRG